MKASVIAAAVLLAGCETMRTIAPHTTAGFEENGILGAIDGASGAILARCRMLDGEIVRVAVDDIAELTGSEGVLADLRERRRQACAILGAVSVIADAAIGVTPNVHGTAVPPPAE